MIKPTPYYTNLKQDIIQNKNIKKGQTTTLKTMPTQRGVTKKGIRHISNSLCYNYEREVKLCIRLRLECSFK